MIYFVIMIWIYSLFALLLFVVVYFCDSWCFYVFVSVYFCGSWCFYVFVSDHVGTIGMGINRPSVLSLVGWKSWSGVVFSLLIGSFSSVHARQDFTRWNNGRTIFGGSVSERMKETQAIIYKEWMNENHKQRIGE